MTVFVYEDVCAAGAGGDESSPPAPSLLAEGRAMLAAVTADGRGVPGLEVMTADTAQDFDRLAAAADWTLVIAPECDGRLEGLCRRALALGGRLLGPSPDAVRLTADKFALFEHWRRHGVMTAESWLVEDQGEQNRVSGPIRTASASVRLRGFTRPVVVKPRDGAGSQATRLSHLPAGPWSGPMIAQEYVEGLAASVACLVGPAGVFPLAPCEQRLSNDGRFLYLGGRLPIATDLADRATAVAVAAVACVPGLLGYVGVDAVLGDDGRDWAIEINPRLTTSYVGLRRLAMGNLFTAMLDVACGGTSKIEWRSELIAFNSDGEPAA